MMKENKTKTILVGVSGGIAAYKSAQLVSDLVKKGYDVHVIMTENATKFIAPLTFETLTKHKVSIDDFGPDTEYYVEHITLARMADCFVICPATANIIAKVVHGIADDMLSSTFLAADCPKIICPAMNTYMLENPVTIDNLKLCEHYGYALVESGEGYLACGDSGKGRLAELADVEEAIEVALTTDKYLKGKKVVVSAGPTQEALDPVRYLSNHSSGKMGYAIAKVAARLGAEVVLVSGPSALHKPKGMKVVDIKSAADMAESVLNESENADVIIMAAAVADYTPVEVADEKMKKKDGELFIPLKRTTDILQTLGERKKEGQIIIGFAMETENLLDNARAKLLKKNCDVIVANSIRNENAGFKADTNLVTLLFKDGMKEYELMDKEEVAVHLFEDCVRGR